MAEPTSAKSPRAITTGQRRPSAPCTRASARLVRSDVVGSGTSANKWKADGTDGLLHPPRNRKGMDQAMDLGGEVWFFRQRVARITEHSVKYSPYAAEPIHTSRSLCICFCRQTEPKD